MALIYCITNLTNEKRYVGKTITTLQKRWWAHVKSVNAGSTSHFHNAIRKHGKDNFELVILEECELSELDALEVMWIRLLATNKTGYNMTEGGEGSIGYHHSEETKQKMSEIAKRRKENSMKGRKHSPETIERMRQAQLGKTHSEVTRAKMRESHKHRHSNTLQTQDGE